LIFGDVTPCKVLAGFRAPRRFAGELIDSRSFAQETSRRPVRLVFAELFPEEKGDNCLLTKGSAFVDLAFCCLIA
jgi:hypothetical protein